MPGRDDRTALIAAFAAGVIMAAQVGGLAARSANFLDHFPVEHLPWMTLGTAVVAVLLVIASARGIDRWGPGRFVSVSFVGSAVLFGVESTLMEAYPQVITIVFFLHATALGGILVSGFWALLAACFDPRTARRKMNRIILGAAVGSIAGAGAAALAGEYADFSAVPLGLAGANLVSVIFVSFLGAPSPARASGSEPSETASGIRALRRNPYLRGVAALVVLGSISTGVVDYLFNAQADQFAADRGMERLTFFAYFYAAQSGLLLFIQVALGPRVLSRLGLAPGLAALPGIVGLGAVSALVFPVPWSFFGTRAGEDAVRNSMYRSSYELLFTPVSARERNATKGLIDVGGDGIGDALGALLVLAILGLATSVDPTQTLLVVVLAIAVVLLVLVNRLRKHYVATLEQSLRERAAHLDIPTDTLGDIGTRTAILGTMGGIPGGSLLTSGLLLPSADDGPGTGADPLADRIQALRSSDPTEIRLALRLGRISPALIPHVIPLLGRSELAGAATQALSHAAERHCGQLVDALLDPDLDLDVRRRLPRVIAAARTQRAADGLLAGLTAESFEVRFRSARALASLVEKAPELRPSRETVFELVAAEVSVTEEVWRSRDLDEDARPDPEDEESSDEREQSRRSLEHLFRLLSLALPREPLRVAFRGLTSDDKHMHGTALEYLEGALPTQVRTRLWPLLED